MIVVQVHVHVHADRVDDFKNATLENVCHSVQEPGVARFELYQQGDDPARFILFEVYRSSDSPGKHKETMHYKVWRDKVESMMSEPRYSVRLLSLYPGDNDW